MPRLPKTAAAADKLGSCTLVVDNGGYSLKAGLVPEDRLPLDEDCTSIPNSIARGRDRRLWVGAQQAKCKDFGEMAFRRPVERGHVTNWESEREIWDATFFEKDAIIKCDPAETNLILGEAPNAPHALQTNSDQIVFEEFGFASYYRGVSSSLCAWNDTQALFTHAESGETGPAEAILVVDSGFSHSNVVPLLQGRPVQSAVRRLEVGGKLMTNHLKELISIRHYNMMEEFHLVNQVKEAISFVSLDFKGDLERTWKGNRGRFQDETRINYVLPDYNKGRAGYKQPFDPNLRKAKTKAGSEEEDETFMTLGNEQFTIPELLFNPRDIGLRQAGLPQLVQQSLRALPDSLIPSMVSNIVLVGGNWNIPGAAERMDRELRMLTNIDYEFRIAVPLNPVTYAWKGGARLAQNKEAYKALCVSREEYQEHGSNWVWKKFAGVKS